MEPDDGVNGSGVVTVDYAISKDNDGPNTEYNPSRIFVPLEMSRWERDGKRSRVFLDSKSLVGTPGGFVTVVARTIDRAGNSQSKNRPLLVNWDDSRVTLP